MTRVRSRLICAVAPAAVALALAASCSSSAASSNQAASARTITVFAAASLTEAFTTIGKKFEAAHPGVSVKFNFAASSTLAEQINQGAPADVFASASAKNLQTVIGAGGASTSASFVKNVMEIAVPPSNPAHIATVADLAKPGVTVALCQPQVPCGVTAAQVFANAKLTVKPVTLEKDVKATLTKVELNEVDAGVVWVTDVRAAGSKVKGIKIPADLNAVATYPIAVLTKAANATGAQSFVDFVLSAEASSVLTSHGFVAP